ncbi:Nudix hydrolase 21 [Phytophthora citrophthora]|uniref:Nudix hydrolase 21 n=1 Tax=Phytophthora citrophthora TaxID=4793 RepID=A0AAD9GRC8_9STRA|nr:Nudix hydrolase 21 [Phytophthora citrophthora]
MRILSLVTLLAFVSAQLIAANADRTGIAAVDSNSALLPRVLAAEYNQVKRSLRRYDPNEFDERDSEEEEADSDDEEDSEDDGVDSEEEEREAITPVLGKVDDMVSKVIKSDDMVSKAAKADDVVEKAAKATSKWKALVQQNLNRLGETGKLVKKLKANDLYKNIALEKMSLSALRQLDDIEDLRKLDIKNKIKGTKTTPDGMRRKMVHTNDMKLPPAEFLVSHVGRGEQLLGANNQRLLSAAVVSKGDDINGKVLLISSSNPKKGDFLLPKGGWDRGEDIEKAALREVIEEGGVKGQLLHKLGDFEFTEGSTAYAYMMKSSTVYDDWAESIRYRLWVRT